MNFLQYICQIDIINAKIQDKKTGSEKLFLDAHYIAKQAVCDSNIVTANGTAQLEFCREILYALHADEPEIIDESYSFYKHGFLPTRP